MFINKIYSKKKYYFICIGLSLLIISCKTSPQPVSSIILPHQQPLKEFQFTYLQAKAKVSYKDFEQSFSSSVDIRIKRDSAIWLSFRPAMSIEAMRVLITKDSMKIMDRIKGEEYMYSLRALSTNIHFELNYRQLQAAITGNLMSSQKPDSIIQHKDFQLIKQKDKSIALNSYVNFKLNKIQQVALTDLATNNTGQVYYSQFEDVNKQNFPFFTKILLYYYTKNHEQTTVEMELKYSKVDISKKTLRFPW
jgi:hypothetical protein